MELPTASLVSDGIAPVGSDLVTNSSPRVCNAWFSFISPTEPRVGFRVSYQSIVESIVDALACHLEAGYFPIAPEAAESDPVQEAKSRVRSAEHRIKTLTAEKEQILSTISSGVLSDALLRELDNKFRSVTMQLADAQSHLDEAGLEVERALAAADSLRAQEDLDNLLLFVSGLRDPHSPLAYKFFKSCVKNLDFHAEDSPNRQRVVSWTGSIEFVTGETRIAVPFAGKHVTLRPVATDGSWALKRLLKGEPLDSDLVNRRLQEGSPAKIRPREVLPALGLEKSEGWIIHVGDSHLLQAYLALYAHHPEIPTWESLIPQLAEEFGDASELRLALESNYECLLTAGNPMWVHRRAPRETESLIATALDQPVTAEMLPRTWVSIHTGLAEEWTTIDGLRYMPLCAHCGSHRRARFAISEPAGYVCLDCRRDAVGLTWPSRLDRFIAYPDLWTAAGIPLDLPSPPARPRKKREKSDRKGRIQMLPTDKVLAILDAYRTGKPLANICTEHGLKNAHDIYYLLDKHSIPLRRFH